MQLVTSIFIAFTATYVAIPSIIRVAIKKKLYDVPDERKVHKRPIPSLGGLGIFIGAVLSLLLVGEISNTGSSCFQYYLAGMFVIFFLGVKDDILILSPAKKFLGQLGVALILCAKANLLITNMHGFLGLHQIDLTASYLLTIFTMVLVINAFNLIDGVDGLAGFLGLIASFVFGTYFYINHDLTHALLGFSLGASIVAFLRYNFSKTKKIFMGDTGSMLIGLVNTILVLKFIEKAPDMSVMPLKCSPAIGFSILAIPLLDTLRVFSIRLYNKQSPFNPDRNHLHHLLLDRGMTHKAISISIAICAVLFISVAYLLSEIGTTLCIASLVSIFFSAMLFLHLTRPQMHLRVVRGAAHEDEIVVERRPAINFFALFRKYTRRRKKMAEQYNKTFA